MYNGNLIFNTGAISDDNSLVSDDEFEFEDEMIASKSIHLVKSGLYVGLQHPKRSEGVY